MKKRKPKKPANPTAADMPQNTEFQEFFANLGLIMSVPKSEVDRLLAEERAAKEPNDPDDGPPMSV